MSMIPVTNHSRDTIYWIGRSVGRLALIILLLTVVGLFSCSSTPTEESITVEFWTIALGDAFADYVNGMIETYERAHPGIRIKWVDVSGGEVAEKFLAAVVGGVPPDLVNLYDLPRFMQFGALRSMDDMVPDTIKTRWIEAFWKGVGYYQGVNYALPWYAGVNMMWYNREIFEEAGLAPDDPPETIDEMLDMGRVIHHRTGKYGVSWLLDRSLGATVWLLLRMEGVWPLFNEDFTRTTINCPEALAFFEKWIQAYRDGVFPPEAIAASHRDDVNWFIEGRAAMFPFSGGWITRYFDQTFERKVVPAPNVVGKSGKVPATDQVLVVPKSALHPREAVNFGLFVTNDENQLRFCTLVAILPSTKKAAADPYFRKMPTTLADAANRISAEDLPRSFVQAPPDVKGWSQMEDVLWEEFAKALGGAQSAQQALDRIERKWNHLLSYP